MITSSEFKLLVEKTRSYRRFDENVKIDIDILNNLVDLAHLSASAANKQPLKYIIVNDKERCSNIFPILKWAGYLKNWDGPKKGERPTAYIIVLNDKLISTRCYCDEGLAIQNIMLGATTYDIGGCILGAFDKCKLKTLLDIKNDLEICYVLAFGKPAEKIMIERIKDGDFRYWRDEKSIHHVPKRELKEIIIK